MESLTYRKGVADYLKNDIYSKRSDGCFYSPFSLSFDDMEHLILINFEKDPDKFYKIFELQQACNKNGKKFLLVIAYRNDGGTDLYYQAGFPFASQSTILNDVNFIVSSLGDAKFEVNADHLTIFLAFVDKYGREIEVKVYENRKTNKKPFFLLAPIGVVAERPKSFPIYSLYEMALTKQKYTDISIEIDKIKHKPDTLPLPIDYSRNYFTRYSADTFNVDWNKNFYGQLLPLTPEKDNRAKDGKIVYELANNSGHYEIKGMSATNNRHQIDINFYPPIADIACLKANLTMNGSFVITTDNTTGYIGGEYNLKKLEDEVELKLQPNKGWKPNESRFILNLLFLIAKDFKNWPKSYVWNAKIKLDAANHPVMKSYWKRV